MAALRKNLARLQAGPPTQGSWAFKPRPPVPAAGTLTALLAKVPAASKAAADVLVNNCKLAETKVPSSGNKLGSKVVSQATAKAALWEKLHAALAALQ